MAQRHFWWSPQEVAVSSEGSSEGSSKVPGHVLENV